MNIGFIPIRCGSKSIPDKNIKTINGKPLVYWAAKALAHAQSVDRVIVASDSDAYLSLVLSFNLPKVLPYLRQAENAEDSASTESVMLEYLSTADVHEDDFFILAQATSPFITSNQIDTAFNQMMAEKSDSLLSCVRTKRFFWQSNGTPVNYDYKNRPRRQDFDGLFMENGAFYINSVGRILKDKNRLSGGISIYEMPEYSAIEIDEESDWLIAETLMRKYINE